MRQRTLLFYTHAFAGGGAELVFARLASAFADAGHRVVFAADYESDPPSRDGPNLRHVVLGTGHGSATLALAALLRAEKPDASFSALGGQNLKHLAAAILAGRRRHCVLGYHGFAVAEPKLLSQISFYATGVTTRLAAHTICVSDVLLRDVRERWRGSPLRSSRIYNPVLPVAEPARDEASILARPPLVVACGRLVAGKGFPALVAAFANVEPGTAELAILGEGPDRPAIEAAIAGANLEGRVHLPGHVVDPGLWYARARCVVIASASESFGLTAAEALAHGLPVVTTDCGGPPEVLEAGRYGRVVPLGDGAALAQALSDALARPGDPAPRLARAADFAMPAIYQDYLAMVETVADDAGP